MALPHFKNIVTARTNAEPIYSNLFEIVVDMPAVIRTTSAQRLLLENATNIELKFTESMSTAMQQFKYSARKFPTTPKQSHVEFNINFNINQNDKKSVEVWALLKRWYDLAWNSQTGELHYKADLLGQITAHIHDRTGEVIRRGDFINVQLKGLSGWDLNWESNTGISDATASFVADYFVDTYFDVQ